MLDCSGPSFLVLVQLSQPHFQSGCFQLLHWAPRLWMAYSCSSNETGSWTRVTILIDIPNFYIFSPFSYIFISFFSHFTSFLPVCVFLPPCTKLLRPEWDVLFSHNTNWSCNISLRPSSSQPSPAITRCDRPAGTHLLPPLLPYTHRWFSTAPLPDLGANIWGAATAATMTVYLIRTPWLPSTSEFPEQQRDCSLPRDPSCSRHSAQLGVPRVRWGWPGHVTPEELGTELGTAQLQQHHSAAPISDAAVTTPRTLRSAAPLHETTLQ